MRESEYATLLENKVLKRWYDNVARGSIITADVYLRRLGHFCKELNVAPNRLLEMKEEELYDLFLDTVSRMEQKGHTGSYIHSTIKAIKSWLLHNRIQVRGRIRIRGAQDAPTLKEERTPIKSELQRILLSGDEKSRSICVLLAHGGFRPETIGDYKGTDGLTIRDFPEISITDKAVTFLKIPTIVVVRKELSKARHQYFTFIGQEACNYIKDYLEARIRDGENINSKSAIITPKGKMKPFIRTANIGDAARDCIRKAGFPWRPYVLRCYFDTQLMLAESKGWVLRDYRQFWMGHKGDIENRYTTNKQKLPETVIEDMRTAYERGEELLRTIDEPSTSEEKLRQSIQKQLLMVAGLSEEDVNKLELSKFSDEEIQAILKQKLLAGIVGEKEHNPVIDSHRQKVVSVQETNAYLERGWEYVAKLSESMVVIRNNFDNN